MPAGNAYPSGHLVPSPILGLANAPIVETKFLELAMSLLDFSPRIPLGTFSILLTCIDFYDLSAWGGCWFVVYIRRFIYKFLNVFPFDYMDVAGSGTVVPVNQVNRNSWVVVVNPNDRPKSVRNRCVIELFVALFVLSLCPFDISVGVGAFVIGLSQISYFFSCDMVLQ